MCVPLGIKLHTQEGRVWFMFVWFSGRVQPHAAPHTTFTVPDTFSGLRFLSLRHIQKISKQVFFCGVGGWKRLRISLYWHIFCLLSENYLWVNNKTISKLALFSTLQKFKPQANFISLLYESDSYSLQTLKYKGCYAFFCKCHHRLGHSQVN